jgi:23S rRNA (adenine2503-C2)-methyltransferase
MIAKTDIMDLTPGQLSRWLTDRGVASYRSAQISRWVYQRQVNSFAAMTDLGKRLREELAKTFVIGRLQQIRMEQSRDGSQKYLFGLADGSRIESVLIPERGHATLCISSQAGCALGCRFCLTGKSGLVRNLSRGEIIAQVRDVRRELKDPGHLTNIVLMGMGEPLANFDNVVSAIDALVDAAAGFGFAGRRITLSTAGLVPRLETLGDRVPVNLAVSLNATENRTRDWLMPINKTYPIEQLLDACRRYRLQPHRRITIEYILIKGVNDSEADALRLVRLLQPLKAKINLIPLNPLADSQLQRPAEAAIERFLQILIDHHYTAIIRRSKGQDIAAACGQLHAAAD